MPHPTVYQQMVGTNTAFTAGSTKTLNGAAVPTQMVKIGTLCALVYANAKTNNLTISAKWQCSDDNSTYRDATTQNNAANVVIVTGTGSDVNDYKVIPCPSEIASFPFVRLQLYTGASSADGTNDTGTISYRYIRDYV